MSAAVEQRAWTACADQASPENQIVESKISDAHGDRNEQQLQRRGNLWWTPDGGMYVYYTPTHWRPRAAPTHRGVVASMTRMELVEQRAELLGVLKSLMPPDLAAMPESFAPEWHAAAAAIAKAEGRAS